MCGKLCLYHNTDKEKKNHNLLFENWIWWSFIAKTWSSLLQPLRMLFAKFGWNCPCGSGEETKIWSIGELIISPVSWNFQSLSVVEGHQTFIQAKFTEICCEAIRPSVSWKIYESHKCHLCAFTFPWRNWSLALHWNKPDSPSLQDVLCNVNGSG